MKLFQRNPLALLLLAALCAQMLIALNLDELLATTHTLIGFALASSDASEPDEAR